MRIKLALLAGAAAFILPASAYKEPVHQKIGQYAALHSQLNEPSSGILYSLGLGSGVNDYKPNFLLPSSFSPFGFMLKTTPYWLISFGVVEEDVGTRATNHFFDAQRGGAPVSFLFDSSADWGLEDQSPVSGQDFSYRDAQEALYRGLTAPTKVERDRALGHMFESLGHVIHLIEDASQPQHVRSDAHCDNFAKCFWIGQYRPSAYEAYTYDTMFSLPLGGYPAADYSTFATPREFWTDQGRGNAEFTSNNFVSIRTNFEGTLDQMEVDSDHPLPAAPGRPGVVAENIENLVGPVGPGQPLHGTIWFVSTPVTDKYVTALSGINPRTTSFSLFESDLRGNPTTFGVYPAFSMNRFNYRAAADWLLPRAAGYSVGMLDYFFRGRIEITPPDGKVYGVIDHGTTNAAGQGFTKVKLKLRNATEPASPPGGGAFPIEQEMSSGTLVAVAKYIPNPCYQASLLGEYNGTSDFSGVITRNGCTLLQYFGGVEKVAVSAELAGQSLSRTSAEEFTFDFSASPIPVDAHDLSLQIVYKGVIGGEHEGIAVAATNLSEPTYITLINGSDYFGIDGTLYTPEEIDNRDDLKARVDGINYDLEPLTNVRILIEGIPVARSDSLAPKAHHRLAVLADAEIRPPLTSPASFQVRLESSYGAGGSAPAFQVRPIQNQLAREPGLVSAIAIKRRGITSWFSLYRFKQLVGSTISAEEVDSKPPMDPSCGSGDQWTCVPPPTPMTLLTD